MHVFMMPYQLCWEATKGVGLCRKCSVL